MSRLAELAAKYGTDKLKHGYIHFYENNLPKEPKRILEIGVKEGRSLAMWAEYFPNAEVHGLDLFVENEIGFIEASIFNSVPSNIQRIPQCFLHKGNQCDYLLLEQLRKYDFDVIIDDGSHNSRDQLITFFGLFNGKHYFIEDLHCCEEQFYSQGLPHEFRASYLFGDIYAVNQGTIYHDQIVFGDHFIGEPRKIVCIKTP